MAEDAFRVATDPDPFEPFLISQAFRVGDLVITSGQAALSPEGDIVGTGDFEAQAAQTFSNLQAVLEAAGSSLDQVIKVTIYLTDMSNFPQVVELNIGHFLIGEAVFRGLPDALAEMRRLMDLAREA